MDKSLVRNNWDATLIVLHTTTDHACNWPEKQGAKCPVECKKLLVIFFYFIIVFPWNTLWSCHKFTEADCQPGIRSHVLSQEIHIFVFLLLSWHWWWTKFENLFRNTFVLDIDFILLAIVDWLTVNVVVCVIVERRHYLIIIIF